MTAGTAGRRDGLAGRSEYAPAVTIRTRRGG
jgi:hypothetical protein